mmetsp:Transcript_73462/g.144166  ORF Transcript_73462/g.144166 Transcript_73462/m.144166 type:complete len:414 (+) Transcript_73462:20-1261(+)
MGKKNKTTAAPPPVPAPSVPVSTSATSSSANKNSYQNLLRALVSLPEGTTTERTEIISKLAVEYRTLAETNRLNSVKLKYLDEEMSQILPKHERAATEATKAKTEHDTINGKYTKLRSLSLTLTQRTKQVDADAAVTLEKEQQKRTKITQRFSDDIARISKKLDTLTAAREKVVSENILLKTELKKYLEEYDAEETKVSKSATTDITEPGVSLTTDGSGGSDKPIDSTHDASAAAPGTPAEQQQNEQEVEDSAESKPNSEIQLGDATTPTPAALSAQEEAQLQAQHDAEMQEQSSMAFQEDASRLSQLKSEEEALRKRAAVYMQRFNAFDAQLSECNAVFREKDVATEKMNKEIAKLEKEKAALLKKLHDVQLSTKVMKNMIGNVRGETEKQKILQTRYMGLIEMMLKEQQTC